MTNKVPLALEELHRSESDLAQELLRISDVHKADHGVFHVTRDLARWSEQHVALLAEAAPAHGLSLSSSAGVGDSVADAAEGDGVLGRLRQRTSELLGRSHDAGVLLLADLRRVHRMAAGVSLDWEVLAQTAQALRDRELLELAAKCHPQTVRQLKWANAQLKESAAQIMVTP